MINCLVLLDLPGPWSWHSANTAWTSASITLSQQSRDRLHCAPTPISTYVFPILPEQTASRVVLLELRTWVLMQRTDCLFFEPFLNLKGSQLHCESISYQLKMMTKTTLPSRRRRRAQLACNPCRVRKTGCDGRRPTCTSCRMKGIENQCGYQEKMPPASGL